MRSRESGCNGSGEFSLTKWLSDDQRFRVAFSDPLRVPADEHMRNGSRLLYLLDGGKAASLAQARIDYHQVRPVTGCGGHRFAFRRGSRANGMTHACQNFRKQHGDQGVILDHEDAESFHRPRVAQKTRERQHYIRDWSFRLE